MPVLFIGVALALIFIPGFLIHQIGDSLMCRRGELPIITRRELRVWRVGAIIGVVFLLYAYIASLAPVLIP